MRWYLPCARASRATATMAATFMAAERRRPAGETSSGAVCFHLRFDSTCCICGHVTFVRPFLFMGRCPATSRSSKWRTLEQSLSDTTSAVLRTNRSPLSHLLLTHVKDQGSPFNCWFKSKTALLFSMTFFVKFIFTFFSTNQFYSLLVQNKWNV